MGRRPTQCTFPQDAAFVLAAPTPSRIANRSIRSFEESVRKDTRRPASWSVTGGRRAPRLRRRPGDGVELGLLEPPGIAAVPDARFEERAVRPHVELDVQVIGLRARLQTGAGLGPGDGLGPADLEGVLTLRPRHSGLGGRDSHRPPVAFLESAVAELGDSAVLYDRPGDP